MSSGFSLGALAAGQAAASPLGTVAGLTLLVLGGTNLVMVAVAPLQLLARGHDLGFVGLAVSVHVLAVFAPSPLTGWLTDRSGTATVAAAGARRRG